MLIASTNMLNTNYKVTPNFKAGAPNYDAHYADMKKILQAVTDAELGAGKFRESYLASLFNDLKSAFFRRTRVKLAETLKTLFNEQEAVIKNNTETLDNLKKTLLSQNKTLIETVSSQKETIENLTKTNSQLQEKVKDLEEKNDAFTNAARPHVVDNSDIGRLRLTPKGLKQYMELYTKKQQATSESKSIPASIQCLEASLKELRRVKNDDNPSVQNTIGKILNLQTKIGELSKIIADCDSKIEILKNTGEIPS